MDCPRCGGRLDRYELADRVEASCDDCGYVGVPVDHESERPADEAWTDVVERYEQAFEDAGDVDTGPAPPTVPEDEGDPEPDTVRTATVVDLPAETTGDGARDGDLDEATTDRTSENHDAHEGHDDEDPTGAETPGSEAQGLDIDAAIAPASDAPADDPDTDALTGDGTNEDATESTTADETPADADSVALGEGVETEHSPEPAENDDGGTPDADGAADDAGAGNDTAEGQRGIEEYAENSREAVASPDGASENGDDE